MGYFKIYNVDRTSEVVKSFNIFLGVVLICAFLISTHLDLRLSIKVDIE
jgi:hypothetical protein